MIPWITNSLAIEITAFDCRFRAEWKIPGNGGFYMAAFYSCGFWEESKNVFPSSSCICWKGQSYPNLFVESFIAFLGDIAASSVRLSHLCSDASLLFSMFVSLILLMFLHQFFIYPFFSLLFLHSNLLHLTLVRSLWNYK